MQTFVLSTGRCGSLTVSKAFAHATNLTSGHETQISNFGEERFAYPDQHVEVDNRLSWFLGDLGQRFPDAFFVHLTRDPEQVAASFVRRWTQPWPPITHPRAFASRTLRQATGRSSGIMPAFAFGIVGGKRTQNRLDAARFMVDVVNHNIQAFLEGRDWLPLSIETAPHQFAEIWERAGAMGDLRAATRELQKRYNSSVA